MVPPAAATSCCLPPTCASSLGGPQTGGSAPAGSAACRCVRGTWPAATPPASRRACPERRAAPPTAWRGAQGWTEAAVAGCQGWVRRQQACNAQVLPPAVDSRCQCGLPSSVQAPTTPTVQHLLGLPRMRSPCASATPGCAQRRRADSDMRRRVSSDRIWPRVAPADWCSADCCRRRCTAAASPCCASSCAGGCKAALCCSPSLLVNHGSR